MDKAGAYIGFSSNFHSAVTTYECRSDGSTSSGRIWTSGASRISSMKFTVGVCARLGDVLIPYFGLGYGQRTLAWEDSAGRWAKVVDCSHRGFALESGLMVRWGDILFSAGCGTVAFGCCSFDVGLGYCF